MLVSLAQTKMPQWQVNQAASRTVPATVSKSYTGLHIRKGLQTGFSNLKQARLLLDEKLANKLQIA